MKLELADPLAVVKVLRSIGLSYFSIFRHYHFLIQSGVRYLFTTL